MSSNQKHLETIHPCKLIKIGNSQGIRISKKLIQAYGFDSKDLVQEATADGILIHATKSNKLSWEETFKEMGKDKKTLDEWDSTSADGLEDFPWE